MVDIKDYKNVLIVGAGKVGTSIGKLIEETEQFNVEYDDPFKLMFPPEDFIPDIIHICFPLYDRDSYMTDIQKIIARYIQRFEKTVLNFYDTRKIVIVDSTIVLGILPAFQVHFEQYCDFVYSPVRATDSVMEEELLKYERYYAVVDNEKNEIANIIDDYYTSIKLKPTRFESAESLVLGKLCAVAWYTTNIAFVQQVDQICKQHGLNFKEVYTKFNKNETIGHKYDEKTKSADYTMERPIFFPGVIGGNCCIQDVILMLREQYGDANFWRSIIQINERQKLYKDKKYRVIENNPSVEPGTKVVSDK